MRRNGYGRYDLDVGVRRFSGNAQIAALRRGE
jgi:hypothetical protein